MRNKQMFNSEILFYFLLFFFNFHQMKWNLLSSTRFIYQKVNTPFHQLIRGKVKLYRFYFLDAVQWRSFVYSN